MLIEIDRIMSGRNVKWLATHSWFKSHKESHAKGEGSKNWWQCAGVTAWQRGLYTVHCTDTEFDYF